MRKKRKIIYFMHINWGWIKQRPQFIAEFISNKYNVIVLHPYTKTKNLLTFSKTHLITIPYFPVLASNNIYKKIKNLIKHCYLFIAINTFNPDIIWISDPQIYKFIQFLILKRHIVIYDCMDDTREFFQDKKQKQDIAEAEFALLSRAKIVFTSSNNLFSKLVSRGCDMSKIYVVRNAFDGNILNCEGKPSKLSQKNKFKIGYIGTISEWLDFDSLLFCLQEIKNIEFHFIGPVTSQIPQHENFLFHGPIEHSKLQNLAKDYDCMIMPFKTNELIEGVDPVKLYEYINYNKNIIAIYYKEIKRFANFVYFYRSKEELVSTVKSLLGDNKLKYSQQERIEFLKHNSWSCRAEQIFKALESLSTERV